MYQRTPRRRVTLPRSHQPAVHPKREITGCFANNCSCSTEKPTGVDDLAQPIRLEFLAPGAEGEQEEDAHGSGDELDEAEECRLAAERKRKGKHAATPQPKSSKRTASVEYVDAPLPAPTKVPYAKESVGPGPDSESEYEEEEEQEEELNYERTEVWLTKKVLEDMGKFDDPKRTATYKERGASGKMAKSGKRYEPEALREIGSEQEFLAYIGDIGFEWLLKHNTAEVPVALAKEFFSTFRLKPITDLDADSITFRLFNQEYEMSIREWSLRMGLFTHAEDEDGIWNERMVGAPKHTPRPSKGCLLDPVVRPGSPVKAVHLYSDPHPRPSLW